MIVFSAFTPHSPLLLPSIGKDNLEKLKKTSQAMEELAKSLEAAKPDVIAVISTHNIKHENSFGINFNDHYGIDLSKFGDHSFSQKFQPDINLIDKIQRQVRRENIPLTLDSDEKLDYGSAVPLLLLTKNLKNIKIIPICYSNLDPKPHVIFGRALKDIFSNTEKRMAIIASGDLSHALSSDAPSGFVKEGKIFDETIRQSIEQMGISKLLSIKKEVVEKSSQCAYEPLLILFGILERMSVKPKILSYEAPFGVGYLVANFEI